MKDNLDFDHPLMPYWTRGSKAYDRQAKHVIDAMKKLFADAELCFAGSQDGEAAVAYDGDGKMVLLLHLEDPSEAIEICAASARDCLTDYLRWSEWQGRQIPDL